MDASDGGEQHEFGSTLSPPKPPSQVVDQKPASPMTAKGCLNSSSTRSALFWAKRVKLNSRSVGQRGRMDLCWLGTSSSRSSLLPLSLRKAGGVKDADHSISSVVFELSLLLPGRRA